MCVCAPASQPVKLCFQRDPMGSPEPTFLQTSGAHFAVNNSVFALWAVWNLSVTMLDYTILHYIVLYCPNLYYALLYYSLLSSRTIIYYTILYYTITIIYHAVLHCTIFLSLVLCYHLIP